jgi:hypothetical protein
MAATVPPTPIVRRREEPDQRDHEQRSVELCAGMAHGVVGAREAATVAQLLPYGDGEERADAVVALQRLAPRLAGPNDGDLLPSGSISALSRSTWRMPASTAYRPAAGREAEASRSAPAAVRRLPPTAATP